MTSNTKISNKTGQRGFNVAIYFLSWHGALEGMDIFVVAIFEILLVLVIISSEKKKG